MAQENEEAKRIIGTIKIGILTLLFQPGAQGSFLRSAFTGFALEAAKRAVQSAGRRLKSWYLLQSSISSICRFLAAKLACASDETFKAIDKSARSGVLLQCRSYVKVLNHALGWPYCKRQVVFALLGICSPHEEMAESSPDLL